MAKFNSNDVARFVANRKPAPGFHAILCVKAQRFESKKEGNDNVMARVYWKMLKDPEDANSTVGQLFSEWLTFPLENEEVEGHTAPSYAMEMTCQTLSGIFDDIYAYPRKDPTTGQLVYKGEYVDKADEMKCRLEAAKVCGQKCEDLYGKIGEGLHAFADKVCFVELGYDDPTSPFPSIKQRHLECPEDWWLSDVYVVTEEVPEVEAPPVKTEKKTRRRSRK